MIVVDVETSGVVPYTHSILSVGALELDNPDNRFNEECRAWEGAHLNADSLEFTGVTKEEATDSRRQTEAELIVKFLDWSTSVTNRILAAQNPSFDRDFLQHAAERAHINWPLAFRTIDVHTLCYQHMLQRGLKVPTKHNRSALDLDAILNYVGIPDEPMPHTALTGALSHTEVISRLLYNKKLLPEFDQFDIPWLL